MSGPATTLRAADVLALAAWSPRRDYLSAMLALGDFMGAVPTNQSGWCQTSGCRTSADRV